MVILTKRSSFLGSCHRGSPRARHRLPRAILKYRKGRDIEADAQRRRAVTDAKVDRHQQSEMHGVNAERGQQWQENRGQDQGRGNNIHEHANDQQHDIDRHQKNPG